jgi:putative membrane protein
MTDAVACDCAKRLHVVLLLSAGAYLVWTGVWAHDLPTWAAEVAPAVVGGVLLAGTYRRFRFSTLSYVFMWLFALILMTGGRYTYARVPVGFWANDALAAVGGWLAESLSWPAVADALTVERNHYDRFGHFFQGVIPALVGRELLLRTSPLRRGKWLAFTVICFALAVSAMYELIEWWAAASHGASAEAFLGTQGDPWDAQKDMLMAGLGAVGVVLFLQRAQDASIRKAAAGSDGAVRP